jgi:hypothetical protein
MTIMTIRSVHTIYHPSFFGVNLVLRCSLFYLLLSFGIHQSINQFVLQMFYYKVIKHLYLRAVKVKSIISFIRIIATFVAGYRL